MAGAEEVQGEQNQGWVSWRGWDDQMTALWQGSGRKNVTGLLRWILKYNLRNV
jgi:hypothetical protein